MLPLDDAVVAQDRGRLQDVSQLPDVPRPIVCQPHVSRVVCQARRPTAHRLREFRQDVFSKERDISEALAERRHVNVEHMQPRARVPSALSRSSADCARILPRVTCGLTSRCRGVSARRRRAAPTSRTARRCAACWSAAFSRPLRRRIDFHSGCPIPCWNTADCRRRLSLAIASSHSEASLGSICSAHASVASRSSLISKKSTVTGQHLAAFVGASS